ncbi:MAG: Heme-binding protein [Verrucomicrobiales bacterium]|nr:Heme-binding protein [Verrucomicrobiales bacterium]
MPAPRPSLFLLPLCLAFLVGPAAALRAQSPDLEAFRRHALTNDGNPENGRRLFNDARLLCASCHSVDGTASKAGPDLSSAGDAFGRRDLVNAVLQPSATIAPGYGTVFVETKSGLSYQGILKQKNADGLQLIGADGKLITVSAKELKSQSGLTPSLMPEGLQTPLTNQEFTDLIQYLTTLKVAESNLVSDQGMPPEIPLLRKAVKVAPYFQEAFTVPRDRVESGLTAFHEMPGFPKVRFILHQTGIIWRMEDTPDGLQKTVFANFPQEVFSERGPNGLLDMAFHPKFAENRKYYLFHQVFEDGKVTTHITEKEFDPGFKKDSGKPARLILKIASVAEDHSGGCLRFGPDGFLYVVMGDTGPHNDPNGHAQNLNLLLGKILRIDVDRADPGLAYAIPKDNPFVGQAGARGEIWAYGLRNPWRFCFDRKNGDLWLADVGQDRVEEVDLIQRGANYGWNVYEGYEPFSNQYRKENATYTKPLFAYLHKYGNSITGGEVFRGDPASSFDGVYICGDYNSKRLFGVSQENGVLKKVRQLGVIPQRIVSFGTDAAGAIYVVGFEGMIYKLDFTGAVFE